MLPVCGHCAEHGRSIRSSSEVASGSLGRLPPQQDHTVIDQRYCTHTVSRERGGENDHCAVAVVVRGLGCTDGLGGYSCVDGTTRCSEPPLTGCGSSTLQLEEAL
jgi:hypothetical protein